MNDWWGEVGNVNIWSESRSGWRQTKAHGIDKAYSLSTKIGADVLAHQLPTPTSSLLPFLSFFFYYFSPYLHSNLFWVSKIFTPPFWVSLGISLGSFLKLVNGDFLSLSFIFYSTTEITAVKNWVFVGSHVRVFVFILFWCFSLVLWHL